MRPLHVMLKNAASRLRVWAIGLTGIIGSVIYFEGESYQGTISEAFHIPAGLMEPSAAEKFMLGVMTLLSHHVVHIVLLVSLSPIVVGIYLMVLKVIRRSWQKLTPKWRFRLTERLSQFRAKMRSWLEAPEFHLGTMPISAFVMLAIVFGIMKASFGLIDEGAGAGRQEANRLTDIAKRCAIGRGYVGESPSCSEVQLKTGKKVTGLLFNTSGANLFLSDGIRTRVIELGSVDSIASVPAIARRPAPKKMLKKNGAAARTR